MELLDDHVIKCLTMKNSPYIGPIENEAKVNSVEEKCINGTNSSLKKDILLINNSLKPFYKKQINFNSFLSYTTVLINTYFLYTLSFKLIFKVFLGFNCFRI